MSIKNPLSRPSAFILATAVAGTAGLYQPKILAQDKSQDEKFVRESNYITTEQDFKRVDEFEDWEKSLKKEDNPITYLSEDGKSGSVLFPPKTRREGIYTPEDFVERLAFHIARTKQGISSAEYTLGKELARGWISPERAKSARKDLESALTSYTDFRELYSDIHNVHSLFMREASYLGEKVVEEIVSEDGSRAPFPGRLIEEFGEFVQEYRLDIRSDGDCEFPRRDNAKEILSVMEELDVAIYRGEQVRLNPRRIVPWYGYGERIDEFINPEESEDIAEALIAVGGVIFTLLGAGAGLAYIGERGRGRGREEEEKDSEEPSEVPTLPNPETEPEPLEIFNPWSVSVGDKDGGRGE